MIRDSAKNLKKVRRKQGDMQGTMLYGPRDIRFEDRPEPYNHPIDRCNPSALGNMYLRIRPVALSRYCQFRRTRRPPWDTSTAGSSKKLVREVRNIKPGQFVVGSFVTSDNTCVICNDGYPSSCVQREFMMARASAALARVACGRDVGPHTRCSF